MTHHPTHHWNGSTYSTLLGASDTNGSMSIAYGIAAPNNGPPAHIHEAEDEIFVVLEGSMTFDVDGRRITCGPLEVAFVPRDAVHSFVTGPEGARGITILTPGGFEGFFAAMAEGNFEMPRDLEKVTAIASQFHSRIVGPGLAMGH